MERIILAGMIFLSPAGCGPRYEASIACQLQAGPRPYPVAYGFGLIAALAGISTDEDRVWHRWVGQCVDIFKLGTKE